MPTNSENVTLHLLNNIVLVILSFNLVIYLPLYALEFYQYFLCLSQTNLRSFFFVFGQLLLYVCALISIVCYHSNFMLKFCICILVRDCCHMRCANPAISQFLSIIKKKFYSNNFFFIKKNFCYEKKILFAFFPFKKRLINPFCHEFE